MNIPAPISSPLLQNHLAAIADLCRQHRVRHLWAFGSVLRSDFKENSDIDLLYEWENDIPDEIYLSNLWGIWDKLEALFQREVDLIEYRNFKNPYLKAEIEASKQLIYEC
ncbi:MAG: nucleotidyltransferase domain-containing protein [Bacteroidetes bacterium]|nr:MAG: nucleotidyltransferase domain-containing protein [Bacteroidota bacterium]